MLPATTAAAAAVANMCVVTKAINMELDAILLLTNQHARELLHFVKRLFILGHCSEIVMCKPVSQSAKNSTAIAIMPLSRVIS